MKDYTLWGTGIRNRLDNRPAEDIISELNGLWVLANTTAKYNIELNLFVYVAGHGIYDTNIGLTCLIGKCGEIIRVEEYLLNCSY